MLHRYFDSSLQHFFFPLTKTGRGGRGGFSPHGFKFFRNFTYLFPIRVRFRRSVRSVLKVEGRPPKGVTVSRSHCTAWVEGLAADESRAFTLGEVPRPHTLYAEGSKPGISMRSLAAACQEGQADSDLDGAKGLEECKTASFRFRVHSIHKRLLCGHDACFSGKSEP